MAAKDSDRLLTPPSRRWPSLHGRTVADKVDSNNADRQPSGTHPTTRRPIRVQQLPLRRKQWSDLDLNCNQTRLPLRCYLMQLVTEDVVHRGASRAQGVGRFKSKGRGQAMI
ncbi:hypothetical protein PR003_g11725 [Phytophthora rubi]|uniref:Uncharacterized protein n=1 Tax=Phytophthora rubi TaxID=129364 RepID=A0A6A3HD85_9STRA|nr:hypothetical protein PR002_g28327 [Phytophthora rubi]KAE9338012.1 hypothetical protein PR003_g11725 [Phytophthora rubi]